VKKTAVIVTASATSPSNQKGSLDRNKSHMSQKKSQNGHFSWFLLRKNTGAIIRRASATSPSNQKGALDRNKVT
jgi:hypothetical protein